MIKLSNVTKDFGDFKALDSICLEIKKGSAYGLLGSNGAGKSTILRLLSGVYKAERGEVLVDGIPTYDNPNILKKIFFISDETVQWNNYTLTEMKMYFKTFYDTFSEEKFNSLWDVLKLPLKKRLATFSKGMKRQAVMICGLACCPEYLLLDEAFDGLDPTMRIIVKRMLVDEMIDHNMTVVISSHNLKEIDEFCDTAGLLHKGQIVFNRELDDLKGGVRKIQASFDKDFGADDFKDLKIMHYDKKGSVVYLIIKGEEGEIREKLAPFNPKFIDMIPLSLEEIFIYEMEVLGYEYTGGIDGIKKGQ